jgi:hypothetical protein
MRRISNNSFGGVSSLSLELTSPRKIRGIRAFTLKPPEISGFLRAPVFMTEWKAGMNYARCLSPDPPAYHNTPDPYCGCGFYAYTDSLDIIPRVVLGIIEGSGRTLLGELGFRAAQAKIVAIIVLFESSIQKLKAIKRLVINYPRVSIFSTIEEAQQAFPLGIIQ